jgi:hypothetical protein
MRFGSSDDNDGNSSNNHRNQHHQYLSSPSSSSSSLEQLSSSPPLSPPKFKTAYADIEDKTRILTFDIEKIDSCCSINLTTEDFVCIVGSGGKRKYVNTLLMRLCVRALISKRQQGGGFEESIKVIFIDAGGDPTAARCKTT